MFSNRLRDSNDSLLLQTRRTAEGVRKVSPQNTPHDGTRMALSWSPTVAGMDSLHDPQAGTAHFIVSPTGAWLQTQPG